MAAIRAVGAGPTTRDPHLSSKATYPIRSQSAGEWVTTGEQARSPHVHLHHFGALVTGQFHNFLIGASEFRRRRDGARAQGVSAVRRRIEPGPFNGTLNDVVDGIAEKAVL